MKNQKNLKKKKKLNITELEGKIKKITNNIVPVTEANKKAIQNLYDFYIRK
jgi:hypothetical protein